MSETLTDFFLDDLKTLEEAKINPSLYEALSETPLSQYESLADSLCQLAIYSDDEKIVKRLSAPLLMYLTKLNAQQKRPSLDLFAQIFQWTLLYISRCSSFDFTSDKEVKNSFFKLVINGDQDALQQLLEHVNSNIPEQRTAFVERTGLFAHGMQALLLRQLFTMHCEGESGNSEVKELTKEEQRIVEKISKFIMAADALLSDIPEELIKTEQKLRDLLSNNPSIKEKLSDLDVVFLENRFINPSVYESITFKLNQTETDELRWKLEDLIVPLYRLQGEYERSLMISYFSTKSQQFLTESAFLASLAFDLAVNYGIVYSEHCYRQCVRTLKDIILTHNYQKDDELKDKVKQAFMMLEEERTLESMKNFMDLFQDFDPKQRQLMANSLKTYLQSLQEGSRVETEFDTLVMSLQMKNSIGRPEGCCGGGCCQVGTDEEEDKCCLDGTREDCSQLTTSNCATSDDEFESESEPKGGCRGGCCKEMCNPESEPDGCGSCDESAYLEEQEHLGAGCCRSGNIPDSDLNDMLIYLDSLII